MLDALNKHLIKPVFQPIVDLKTGEIFANEALMSIGTENMPASEFIEAAENLGVITRMDLILYEEIFRLIREKGYTKKVFLNFSARILTVKSLQVG